MNNHTMRDMDNPSIIFNFDTAQDLDPLIEEAGKAKAVLIGEATHGTSEFYKWRAAITKRLIEEKGFSFVAVEGDWPNCYQVNKYVKDQLDPSIKGMDIFKAFNRWPTWMWANYEVFEFVEWLAQYNKGVTDSKKVGFYGLDLYSLWESLQAAAEYLDKNFPQAAHIAKQAYQCFEPFKTDVEGYAWASVPESCEESLVKLLSTLEHLSPTQLSEMTEDKFSAEQNALVAADAENYYRIMLRGDEESWNLRDQHMSTTFMRLLDFHRDNTEPKGIIWAHNTHIGDARATDMAERSEVNIGQLVRERLAKDDAYLIGFGTFEGSVLAADDWNAKERQMPLPPAVHDSWERFFHDLTKQGNGHNKMAIFSKDPEQAKYFDERKNHRAVGVVYDPNAEFGNYVSTNLRHRYDAFMYIDKTTALNPIDEKSKIEGPPDTYPFAA